jgi:hypothetical protein
MRRLIHPIKDNSLSIVFFALFAICISIQSYAAWLLQNETLATYGNASIGYWDFLSSGTYLEGLASNWQAAVLQLASLIFLSSFLFQRGAPHSLNPKKAKFKHKWRKHFSWVYRHSFFMGFLLLFVVSFVFHGKSASDFDLGISAVGQILDDNPGNLAGGVSGNRDLCRIQYLSASAGLARIEED